MKTDINFIDLNTCDYTETWQLQEKYFDESVKLKGVKNAERNTKNHLIFVEHPHVYTLGKSGDENNLLVNYIELKAKEAQFVKTNRGGDITYHGPGQLVGYPILDLENFGISLREYIFQLEEVIINSIAHYGLQGERDEKATGVWLDPKGTSARKICAIGVRSSRYVTMHGFALNINTDLTYFQHINPCGFIDKGVTSLKKELGHSINMNEVKSVVLENFKSIFSSLVL